MSPSRWEFLLKAEDADVVNGERNKIILNVENQSDRNITITNVGGSFHHPESNRLVKNVRVVCPVSYLRAHAS